MEWAVALLPQLLTAALAVGVVWALLGKVGKLAQEIKELIEVLFVALADKKLTQEEIDKIMKEAKDVPAAFKEMFAKDD